MNSKKVLKIVIVVLGMFALVWGAAQGAKHLKHSPGCPAPEGRPAEATP
jgi:hypothetical protein